MPVFCEGVNIVIGKAIGITDLVPVQGEFREILVIIVDSLFICANPNNVIIIDVECIYAILTKTFVVTGVVQEILDGPILLVDQVYSSMIGSDPN